MATTRSKRRSGQLTAQQILDRAMAERREKEAQRECKRYGHRGIEGHECQLCRDQIPLF